MPVISNPDMQLEMVLNDHITYDLFFKHCQELHCEEALLFIEDYDGFRELEIKAEEFPDYYKNLYDYFVKIHDTYFASGSEHEVNVSYPVRKEILDSYKERNGVDFFWIKNLVGCFEKSVRDLKKLLIYNCLNSFLDIQEFKNLPQFFTGLQLMDQCLDHKKAYESFKKFCYERPDNTVEINLLELLLEYRSLATRAEESIEHLMDLYSMYEKVMNEFILNNTYTSLSSAHRASIMRIHNSLTKEDFFLLQDQLPYVFEEMYNSLYRGMAAEVFKWFSHTDIYIQKYEKKLIKEVQKQNKQATSSVIDMLRRSSRSNSSNKSNII